MENQVSGEDAIKLKVLINYYYLGVNQINASLYFWETDNLI
jgi:hypothetical protein